jgi:hypothetical protein
VANINIFGSFVLDNVCDYFNGALIVTQKRYAIKFHSIVQEGLFHPK